MKTAIFCLELFLLGFFVAYGFYLARKQWAKKKVREIKARGKERHLAGADGYFRVDPGNEWNPLLGYPRNIPCWCDSGVKAKKCCLPTVRQTVSHEQADTLRKHMIEVRAWHAEQ